MLALICMAAALALVSLGGGLYEYRVVDPAWPRRVELIQPARGGISRRRFWIPAHVAFELALIGSLAAAWSQPEVRTWLLVAFTSHGVMRIWSAFDFIPCRRTGDHRKHGAQVDAPQPLAVTPRSHDMRGDARRLCCGGSDRLICTGGCREMTKNRLSKEAIASHKELIARVGDRVRRMGAQSVLTSQAVAVRFGLHPTDLECLDLIYLQKNASAGELAKATRLTSGAVTALIDRLEAEGYVERIADPVDRRKVQVRIRPKAIMPIQAVYAPIQARMFDLWSTFSAHELKVIIEFLSRSTDLAVECAEEIRRGAASFPSKRRRPRAGPRGLRKSKRSEV